MLKDREEQIQFWFCWCFPPTGPMHLISALSLWIGTLQTKHGGVLQLPDSIKWRTWIYEHKHNGNQTLSFPKEILKNLCVRVGTLYAPANFVVIETGTEERAPIILGRPFPNTRAVIYANAAKISLYIKGKKETFLQEQDYTNFRAIPTWTKEEDQQEEQEQANVDRIS